MGRKRSYPTAFRQQMVALVRSGRSANDLAKEFEPTAQMISAWVRQADRDEGRRDDGLTSGERVELQKLRKENKRLRQERDPCKTCAVVILYGSRGLIRTGDRCDTPQIFRYIKAHQAIYPITVLLRLVNAVQGWGSGPLLDRLAIVLTMPCVKASLLPLSAS